MTFLRKEYLGLFILFIVHLIVLWPGTLSPDSQGQYNAAIAGQYSDHHPFIMSFLWRYLDKLYPGPGLMLLMQLSLLYDSTLFLIKSVDHQKWRFALVFTPLIPHILCYSCMIWKDVACAYSYMFVLCTLAYLSVRDKKLTFSMLFPLLIILAYGTLVKFQAQYLAPIVLIWMALHRADYTFKKSFLKNVLVTASIFYGMIASIQHFGPKVQENHSWQFVKLYDLSAIAVHLNEDIFPEFTKTKTFSMKELHQRFNHQRVDDLVFSDPILQKGSTEEERQKVWNTWASEVLKHPLIYLRHRAANLGYVLLSTPGFDPISRFINQISEPGSMTHKTLYISARITGYLFLAHLIGIALSFGYLMLSLVTLGKTRSAIPLFFLNATGLAMVFFLYFFSMAGTPRYTYISICLVHASHVFAWMCWKRRKQTSPLSSS